MKLGSKMRRAFVAVVACGMACGGLAGQASATDVPQSNGGTDLTPAADRAQLDRQIDSVLASTTGGTRVGANQIAWAGRGVILTLPMPGEETARAAGEKSTRFPYCPRGRVCLFMDSMYKGARLTLYKCGFVKLRHHNFTNITSSWVNAQTGKAYSQLDYWDGSKVRPMDGMVPTTAHSFGTSWKNDKADFVRVC